MELQFYESPEKAPIKLNLFLKYRQGEGNVDVGGLPNWNSNVTIKRFLGRPLNVWGMTTASGNGWICGFKG